jgi:Tfp pilus assembly protein PilO
MMQFRFREMMFTSLLLGMVAGTYAMVVRPHTQQRQQRLAEIRSIDTAISSIGNSTDGLESLSQQVNQQRQETAFFRSRLPKECDVERAIHEVIQTAGTNSLQSGEVRLLKREPIDGIGAQPVRLEFTGNFNGIYSFLLQLEQMSRITRITQLDLSSVSAHDGQLKADMTLMMYFEPDVRN